MADALPLAILCVKKVVSERYASPNQTEQFHSLFCCEIPLTILHSALKILPINELLDLEERYPRHGKAFQKTWLSLCEKCATKSASFRTKLKHLLNGRKIWSVWCHFEPRNVLLNHYFLEIFDDYEHRYAASRRPKLQRLESPLVLQEAMGGNKHSIADEKMMQLLGNHIVELNLHARHFVCLQDLLNLGNICLKNVVWLNLYMYTSLENCELRSLLKTVFNCANVQVLHIYMLPSRACSEDVKNTLAFCSQTPKSEREPSLWDQALLDEHQLDISNVETTGSGLYDDMFELDRSTPNLNLYNIKEVHILYTGCGDTFDMGSGYAEAFSRWFCLENLTVSCGDLHSTEGLVRGITRLCRSECSNLKRLVVCSGVWHLAELQEFGTCLNRTKICNKSIVFEDCCLILPSSTVDEQNFFNVGVLRHYTITDVTIRTHAEASCDWTLFSAAFPQLLSTFLHYYNPECLVLEDGIQHRNLLMHEHTISANMEAIRLQRVVIHRFWNVHFFCHLIRTMSSNLGKILESIDLVLVCCKKEITNISIMGFRNVIIENNDDQSRESSHSIEDFVAQM